MAYTTSKNPNVMNRQIIIIFDAFTILFVVVFVVVAVVVVVVVVVIGIF